MNHVFVFVFVCQLHCINVHRKNKSYNMCNQVNIINLIVVLLFDLTLKTIKKLTYIHLDTILTWIRHQDIDIAPIVFIEPHGLYKQTNKIRDIMLHLTPFFSTDLYNYVNAHNFKHNF